MAWLQFVLAGLCLCWALLAVTEVPLGFLWEPAVAATEWGHLLGLLTLLVVAIPGWREPPGQVGVGLALLACALFLSPVVRARSVAALLPAQVERAFGGTAPASLPGAPSRPEPLVLGDLFGLGSTPELQVTTHVYRQEPVALSLDLYLRAEGPRPAPVVIQMYGGSWSGGDNTQLPGINRYLAARGYAVAAINYRLVPEFTFPAPLEDVRAAIAWVKSEGPALGLDAERIVLMGRSAGGHLALVAGYDQPDPAVRGVVAYYPPTDMVWSWEHPADPWVYDSHGVLGAFLKGDPSSQPEIYKASSPLEFTTPTSPPTLLVHGGRDELVFEAQSERLAKRLTELGVANLHLSLPWASHGCDANMAGPTGQLSVYAIERFLASVTKPGS